MTLRDLLNRLLWDPKENRADHELTFIHRGAPMDVKVISCRVVKKVTPLGFFYEDEEGSEVFIPFHRVLEIRNVKTEQISWKKRILEK